MLARLDKTLTIFLKNPNETLLSDMFEHFLALTEKKVIINILVNERELKIRNKNIWRKLTTIGRVQVVKNVLFDAFLFDNQEMLIFLTSFFRISIKDENMVFLIQENRLITYTITYFKMLWSMSEKFSIKNYS